MEILSFTSMRSDLIMEKGLGELSLFLTVLRLPFAVSYSSNG